MEEEEKEERKLPPEGTVVFRTDGVYQRLHLCDYLRELPENPAREIEK